MRINKTRIHNLKHYTKHIADGTLVKIIIEGPSRDALSRAGFSEGAPDGTTILPHIRGAVSRFNAEGKSEPDKTQPKEMRYIRTVYWRWKQWKGRDQTEEREEFRDQYRECYPRTLIQPPSIELTLRRLDGKILIVSPTINLDRSEDVKHIVNLFLELFGACEITSAALTTLDLPNVKRLNWNLLPPGEYPWGKMKEHLATALRRASDAVSIVIKDRQQTLVSLNPTTIYVGINGFSDYIAYEFKAQGLVVLESIRRDNAIYVFDRDWEAASRLSKKEILDASLQKARIVHAKDWKERLKALLGK